MSRVETQSSRGRLQPGQRVGDHLVVRSVLGQGGTAVVYEALHTRLGATVALKVLDVPDSFREDGILRMQREAEVCASIDDPHVPRIYDIDALPDGTPYVVMEKVSGITLEEMISSGPLALETVLAIADDLMAALEAVHRAGVVHRDIKPANLILKSEADGCYRVRLMDFGVSKSVCREPNDPKLTRVGTVVGTPHYMAPEQITGEMVDARADVYATGVVLFEMLSGRMPFEGESTSEVVAAVLRHAPVPLVSLRPDVPREVESVVMRAMAPRANARYLTVRDMRCALAQCDAARPFARAPEGAFRQSRPSTLSLMPAPRGLAQQAEFSGFDLHAPHHTGSARTSTRRYSILGAGLAVLVGTVGFPRAAKHVSVTDLAPAQVAKADMEQPAPAPLPASAPAPLPASAPAPEPIAPVGGLEAAPGEVGPAAAPEQVGTTVLEPSRYRLELPTQHLQIAVSPEAAPQVEAPAPEASAETGAQKDELSAEERAARDEERRARRRLRRAETVNKEELQPGVLIQDYLQQIEAIQREANENSGALPETRPEAPPAAAPQDLPPNPYPN